MDTHGVFGQWSGSGRFRLAPVAALALVFGVAVVASLAFATTFPAARSSSMLAPGASSLAALLQQSY